jgi:hypothetical protein
MLRKAWRLFISFEAGLRPQKSGQLVFFSSSTSWKMSAGKAGGHFYVFQYSSITFTTGTGRLSAISSASWNFSIGYL